MTASQPAETIATLGVVGAGTMGAGIAQLAASRGDAVVLYDVGEDLLARAREGIGARYARDVERGRQTREEADAALGRIRATTRLADVAGAQAVIEAAPEDLALKREIFAELDRLCPPETILASNTSSLSITSIAAACRHPARVAGMHFFNPAPVLPLVEVISGAATAEATAEAVAALARRLGKTPVRALDTPGFIVNRVARPFYGEALRILDEGIAGPAEIDRIVRSAGFRMGPFELMDLIGVDVNFAVTRSIYEATFQEPRYRPSPLQARLVAAERLGRKSGRGFYRYEDGRPVAEPSPDPLAEVAPLDRPANVLLAGQGPAADDLALALQDAGQQVTVYAGEVSAALEGAGIPRARRLRDVLLTTTVAIEATLGPHDLKRAYWYELDETLPPHVPLLALALGHSATELGSWSAHPARVVGFGYVGRFADAPLVELAPGALTGVDTVQRAAAFLRGLGKEVAAVGDQPGQVLTRILSMLVNEAAFAVEEGIATPADVDTAVRLGLNYPRGPLEWGDALGLDRVVAALDGLRAYYGEERYRVAPLLRRALLAGQALGVRR
ncbi:MAG TPA: 3-hydroxyacyl-CoA dehydrogenase [Thermomicrobiales bacterium]|nr:3-hydroxyacyl-CoA dehydrogenase [Thermomicrobiales bacterium]